MAEYSKLGYGDYGNIDTAVANGVLNGKDIVITKDTSELVYIRDDGSKQVIRSRAQVFADKEAAITALNAAADTYAGQTVMIKGTDGKYQPYTVQTDSGGAFTAEPLMTAASTGSGLLWQEF